jgi:hypothetical protein
MTAPFVDDGEGFGGEAVKTLLPPPLQRAVIASPMSAAISGEATS